MKISHATYVCELHEGDRWTVFEGCLVIVNPNRPPRMVDADGRELSLLPEPALKDKT